MAADMLCGLLQSELGGTTASLMIIDLPASTLRRHPHSILADCLRQFPRVRRVDVFRYLAFGTFLVDEFRYLGEESFAIFLDARRVRHASEHDEFLFVLWIVYASEACLATGKDLPLNNLLSFVAERPQIPITAIFRFFVPNLMFLYLLQS